MLRLVSFELAVDNLLTWKCENNSSINQKLNNVKYTKYCHNLKKRELSFISCVYVACMLIELRKLS